MTLPVVQAYLGLAFEERDLDDALVYFEARHVDALMF